MRARDPGLLLPCSVFVVGVEFVKVKVHDIAALLSIGVDIEFVKVKVHDFEPEPVHGL